MAIFQVHWQEAGMREDSPTEFIEEKDVETVDEMNEWVREVHRKFPAGKDGCQLMICNDSSKHFIRGKAHGDNATEKER